MSETDCHCGHGLHDHAWKAAGRGKCRAIVSERSWLDFDLCPCPELDVSILPTPGERLEFGRHRMNIPDAEAAPAWPSLDTVQGRADAKFKRALKREAGA